MAVANKNQHCSYSVAEWTRQPSSFEAIFGLELPYTPPKNPIAACIWRWRLWGEVTFALSMLEPWEKLLTGESADVPDVATRSLRTLPPSRCVLCFHHSFRHHTLDIFSPTRCHHSWTCAILPTGPGRC